jgi:hypothetical protein
VGKISNETNRVGNENPGLRLGVQRSHGGIQGREEPVGHEHFAQSERPHQ